MNAISPIDGRYANITLPLQDFFSEFSFFKYRLFIEIKYFLFLIDIIPQLKPIDNTVTRKSILNIWNDFSTQDFHSIKKYENTTKHDIKALEYFIQDKFKTINLEQYSSFIHFALTSQDINTSANILAIQDAIKSVIIPTLQNLANSIRIHASSMKNDVMLAFTHGQPAVPTTMGKELYVFYYRLKQQLQYCNQFKFTTKFGGAVGNLNAHYFAFPHHNWDKHADDFIHSIGLYREKYTTQISNYDNISNLFNFFKTINNIVNDLNIDSWLYISKGYFKLHTDPKQIGSSTMPQKINPIHFENSEGNICIANAFIEAITRKLPVSRLQRDLTDSTILRNIGSLFSYCLIAYSSTITALSKISINDKVIKSQLINNPDVLTEPIQTILRKHKYTDAYETLHSLATESNIDNDVIQRFISNLPLHIYNELQHLDIFHYIGNSNNFS